MTNKTAEIRKILQPLELLVIIFYSLIIAAILIYRDHINYWLIYVIVDIFIIWAMIAVSRVKTRPHSTWMKFISYWYAAPLILLTFKEIYFLIAPIRGAGDYDFLLIKSDFAIFGFNPTQALYHIANPFLTELLQIAYTSFYLLPMILGWSLYKEKKLLPTEYVIFSTVYGFYVSYIGYFFLPAVGPRFMLHDFAATDTELPGLVLTKFLRFIVNSGESIPPGTIDPVLKVQRDVFPSGHTMMTAMVMYLAFHFRAKSRYFLLITGMLLIFATVYLRYHYVTDVFAGLLCALFALWSGRHAFNYFKKVCGKTERI